MKGKGHKFKRIIIYHVKEIKEKEKKGKERKKGKGKERIRKSV